MSDSQDSKLPEPYYDRDGITIYHGDCRDILPLLGPVDLVLTDPPYPGFSGERGRDWEETDIASVERWLPQVRQFVFWDAVTSFPLSWSACHIWHKPNGQSGQHYERIFERFGQKVCRVWRIPIINYETLPEWVEHPTQKPLSLVRQLLLLDKGVLILDPFMGSGTTLRAAKDLGRRAIGIEIEEKYCAIAVKRLAQEVLAL